LKYADRVKELKKEMGGNKKQTAEEKKAKELGLARNNNKTSIVKVDQVTG
jgi:hypothetical protein